MNDLILVGKLGRTHALSGAIYLHDLSDFGEQFCPGARFFLANGKELEIEEFDEFTSVVKFAGINSINEAKQLVNAKLYSTKSATRQQFALSDGEFFYFDVIGLKVIENGTCLGEVEEIYDQGANFLLKIRTDLALKERYEREHNSPEALAALEDFKREHPGKLNSQQRKKQPKIATLAGEFFIPYVDFYVREISGAVHTSGAMAILLES